MNPNDNTQQVTWADMTFNERQISLFFERERPLALDYLAHHFSSLSPEDREDIVQNAAITLWQQLTEGRQPASEGHASLAAYYRGICRISALEQIKQQGRNPVVLIDDCPANVDADESLRRIGYLIRLADQTTEDDDGIARRKAALVRQMVRSLPPPCNELLWSLYRDGLTMRALAKLYHYASEAVARVMSHNCRQKFARRYTEEVKKIY